MRIFKVRITTLLLAWACISFPGQPTVAAGPVWKLVYDSTQIEQKTVTGKEPGQPEPGDAAASEASDGALETTETTETTESREEVTFLLAPTFVVHRQGASESIYDFAGKRTHFVNHDTGELSTYSLYSEIGFREYELKNREYLAKVLASGGVAERSFDALPSEVLFTIESSTPANPEMSVESKDGVGIYSLNGVESVRFRASDVALPAALKGALVRSWVYSASLHPKILEALSGQALAQATAPAELEFRYFDVATSFQVRRQLREAEAVEFDLLDYLGKWQLAKEADIVLRGARQILGAADLDPATVESYQQRTAAAVEAGNFLEAMLTQLESVIATGESDAEWLGKIRSEGAGDKDLTTLFQGLAWTNSQPAEAMPLFESLPTEKLPSAHVLSIFKGNAANAMGEFDQARAHFLDALKGNPYLAGVYKDLGDLYYARYETSSAWQCWDAGRRIMPEHPMLSQVSKLEQRLEAQYPLFF